MNYILSALLLLLCLVFILEMYHSLKRSSTSWHLIETYRDDLQNKQLIDEIYAYCQKDWKLRRIIKANEVTPADIEKIYQKLLKWGNFHKGHRFVPITSFFYVNTLDYLVKHKNDEAKTLTMHCMNALHI
ncbi:MAG: hypothetical protein K6F01_11585 [Selenomonas sp.]|uniref:hypothetical protein n=1 Tax=Selenomonas sp. TaxID=2053611 RepID=UPI0025CBB991|nr:hypothetical protein [Selenomonas sp.]MCR5440055.1 hypothetical protein [Selenomonas sp.]